MTMTTATISHRRSGLPTGPLTPRSITSLQGPLSLSHDYNSVESVNGGCRDCNVTTSQSAMSSDLSSRKSVDIRPTAPGPSSPTPSPYDSDDCVCDCGCAAVDQSSRKSDNLTGPTCPALSLYDSNTNDDDDSDEDDNYDSDGFPLSRRAISLDDIGAQGSICPATTPYDSNAADDNTSGNASSQWSMSPDLPSDAISKQQQQQQQTYDPTLTAYNDNDYVAIAQPSPSG